MAEASPRSASATEVIGALGPAGLGWTASRNSTRRLARVWASTNADQACAGFLASAARAARKTSVSILSVSLPVEVFCWLG